MKNLYLISLISCILISLTGCKAILLKSKGISKPKLETRNSILTYLEQKGTVGYGNLFIVQDSASFYELIGLVPDYPGVDFFTTTGDLIIYSRTGRCTQVANDFASQLKKEGEYFIDSSYRLDDITGLLHSILPEKSIENQKSDFVVLVYWALYLGSMNQDVFDIISTLERNKEVSVKIYLVNMDFQKDWKMKEIPRIKFF